MMTDVNLTAPERPYPYPPPFYTLLRVNAVLLQLLREVLE